ATTDQSNAQVASFYPGAMAHASELSLKDVKGGAPQLVIISPNDPNAMQQYVAECQELGIPYVYDPSQQIVRFDGSILRTGVEAAHAMFMNEYEFELVKDKTGMDEKAILEHLDYMVVTLGPK